MYVVYFGSWDRT
jgi:hypothetical protein